MVYKENEDMEVSSYEEDMDVDHEGGAPEMSPPEPREDTPNKATRYHLITNAIPLVLDSSPIGTKSTNTFINNKIHI